MKRSWQLVMMAAALLLATACKDSKETAKAATSATAATASATATAVAADGDACSQYIAALDACIAKLPADQAAGLVSARDAQKNALKDAPAVAKEQMQSGCSTGLAALKQNSMCN